MAWTMGSMMDPGVWEITRRFAVLAGVCAGPRKGWALKRGEVVGLGDRFQAEEDEAPLDEVMLLVSDGRRAHDREE
jgi:hypothetical protein